MKHMRTLGIAAIIFLAGWWLYRSHREQQRLQRTVESLLLCQASQGTVPVVHSQKPASSSGVSAEESSGQELPASASTAGGAAVGVQAENWRQLQSKMNDSVVQLIVHIAQIDLLEPYKTPNQCQASGSGFFINDEGDLITNAHVVNQSKAVFIQIPSLGKRRLRMDVIGISPERDLALLRLQPDDLKLMKTTIGRVPSLQFADSDKVSRSQEMMTLGYPLGQKSLKSTTGVISGREHINGQFMIQISAAINPGNSGGPSIDREGKVIGVNTSGYAPSAAQNVNYIIPSNEVKLFLHQLKQLPDKTIEASDAAGRSTKFAIKLLRKPFLGVIYHNATEELVEFLGNPSPGGLYVADDLDGSPLHRAGVVAGDMIYSIDGNKLDIFGDMMVPWSEDKISITDYVSRLMVGDTIKLVIYRNGKRKDVALTFDEQKPIAVRPIYPSYEPIDYEIIGGMVLMQLSINHIPALLQVAPDLAAYTDVKKHLKPAVIITHVMPDSVITRARALSLGAVIKEVNGQEVGTLDEFRKAVRAGLSNNKVTIRAKDNTLAVFNLREMLKEEQKLSDNYYYEITDFTKGLIAAAGLSQGSLAAKPQQPLSAVGMPGAVCETQT